MNNLKFSIVTPCFNTGKYVDETIRNIAAQTYRNVEHIVMDGGSTDNTLSILKSHPHILWTSEKDKGQSDAINKGFKRATGEIFAWQNADDLYFPDALETVADFFNKNTEVDLVYGEYQQISPDGSWICDVHPPAWNPWLFGHGRFAPVQPTVFWRRHVFEAYGELDLGLNYCMDIDFYSQSSKKFRFARIQKMLGKFRVHDDSKTQNPENERKVYLEYRKVLARNFSYGPLDYLAFNGFYYRSRIAAKVKARWLKRI